MTILGLSSSVPQENLLIYLFILLVFRQGKTASAKKAVLQLCPATTNNKVQHTLHITTEQSYNQIQKTK